VQRRQSKQVHGNGARETLAPRAIGNHQVGQKAIERRRAPQVNDPGEDAGKLLLDVDRVNISVRAEVPK